MKKIQEADISGEKLTHMTHIEDMLYAGPKAAEFAYKTLLSIASSLRGDKPEAQVRTTVKIDGCFSPSTLLLTEQGLQPIIEVIQRVSQGEIVRVKGYDHQLEQEDFAEVKGASAVPSGKPWVRITTDEGEIVCTADHPIYTKNRGYIEAQSLVQEDVLLLS